MNQMKGWPFEPFEGPTTEPCSGEFLGGRKWEKRYSKREKRKDIKKTVRPVKKNC